jgi:hypothetical protein
MIRATAALALAIVLAGCAGQQQAAREADALADDSAVCTHVDAPMMDIPTAENSEPLLRIPRPQGWERSIELDEVDDSLRFALTNTTAAADAPPQNVAVVSLERVPAPAGDDDAQTILRDLRRTLRGMLDERGLAANVTSTPATVCGLPAQILTRPGTAVGLGTSSVPATLPMVALQAVTAVGDQTYLVSVMTTAEPDDPKYRQDAELILSGFQVLAPSNLTA